VELAAAGGSGRAKLPLGEFAFVIGDPHHEARRESAAIHGFTQYAAPVGFKDLPPRGACSGRNRRNRSTSNTPAAAIFVCQANGVTISPLYITIEVSLVGIGNPDGAGVKEIQTFEL
jgi:hypothetical protein